MKTNKGYREELNVLDIIGMLCIPLSFVVLIHFMYW